MFCCLIVLLIKFHVFILFNVQALRDLQLNHLRLLLLMATIASAMLIPAWALYDLRRIILELDSVSVKLQSNFFYVYTFYFADYVSHFDIAHKIVVCMPYPFSLCMKYHFSPLDGFSPLQGHTPSRISSGFTDILPVPIYTPG